MMNIIPQCRHLLYPTVLSLVINTDCQLRCPHCYLGESKSPARFSGKGAVISKETVDLLFQEIGVLRSGSMIIAIAGMEPFLNSDSAEMVQYISNKCHLTGMKFEVITNGLGLYRYMDDTLAKTIDCLHISLDGGPETYQYYRGASFDKVLRGVEHAAKQGISTMNILHTLSSGNIDNIDDMVEGALSIGQRAPLGEVWFSPFVWGKNGKNNVSMVSTLEIVKRLVSSRKFMAADPAQHHLILDDIHLLARGENKDDLFQMILEQYDDEICSRIIEMGDPVEDEGIARIAPDGSILHPAETLHGEYTPSKERKLGSVSLKDAWEDLLIENQDILKYFYP